MQNYLVWFIQSSGCKYWLAAYDRKDALQRFANYNSTSVSDYMQCRAVKQTDKLTTETHLYQGSN